MENKLERVLSEESLDELIPPITAPVAKPLPTLVKNFPLSEGHHFEVLISHIVNPSLFYVRISGDNEKKLEKYEFFL